MILVIFADSPQEAKIRAEAVGETLIENPRPLDSGCENRRRTELHMCFASLR